MASNHEGSLVEVSGLRSGESVIDEHLFIAVRRGFGEDFMPYAVLPPRPVRLAGVTPATTLLSLLVAQGCAIIIDGLRTVGCCM